MFFLFLNYSGQFSSVTQSCLTLCDPMDCCSSSFPVHHQLAVVDGNLGGSFDALTCQNKNLVIICLISFLLYFTGKYIQNLGISMLENKLNFSITDHFRDWKSSLQIRVFTSTVPLLCHFKCKWIHQLPEGSNIWEKLTLGYFSPDFQFC